MGAHPSHFGANFDGAPPPMYTHFDAYDMAATAHMSEAEILSSFFGVHDKYSASKEWEGLLDSDSDLEPDPGAPGASRRGPPANPDPGARPTAQAVAHLADAFLDAFQKYHGATGAGDLLAALDAAAPTSADSTGGLMSGRIDVARRLLLQITTSSCEACAHLCFMHPTGAVLPSNEPPHPRGCDHHDPSTHCASEAHLTRQPMATALRHTHQTHGAKPLIQMATANTPDSQPGNQPDIPEGALVVCGRPEVPGHTLDVPSVQHLPETPSPGGHIYTNDDEVLAGGRASG